jgi:exodeoxyribonuclease VII small subunit
MMLCLSPCSCHVGGISNPDPRQDAREVAMARGRDGDIAPTPTVASRLSVVGSRRWSQQGMSRKKTEEIPYEQAVARLQEIADALESGDVGLDEALALFEEGVKLTRRCAETLRKAEGKIETLIAEMDGILKSEDVSGEFEADAESGPADA